MLNQASLLIMMLIWSKLNRMFTLLTVLLLLLLYVRMYWTEHSELNSEGLLSWIEYSKLCSVSKTLNWTLWMWLWSFIILIKHFKLCYNVQIKMNWMFQFNIPNGINNSTNYWITHSKHYSHAHLRCWIKCSIWMLQMQLWCPNTE